MWNDIRMRQSRRDTFEPWRAADSSAKLHCVGSASRPAVDIEPIERTPMPYLPASVMPEGLIIDATAIGMSSWSGRSWSLAARSLNHSHS